MNDSKMNLDDTSKINTIQNFDFARSSVITIDDPIIKTFDNQISRAKVIFYDIKYLGGEINSLRDVTSDVINVEKVELTEGTYIQNWKNIFNLSARVLDFDYDVVLLECLIDKESRLYEEREFKRSIFKGYDIEKGSLFKVCYYERDNQCMIEIKNTTGLVADDDFPKSNLAEKFKNLKLNS